MNIKRPSKIFALCAIGGIVLSYNKMYIIDKVITFSVIFLLLIFCIYQKKLKMYMLLICMCVSALFFYRYKNVNENYNKIDNYIENNIGKKSELVGTITDFGKSTNSEYIDISNVIHIDKNIGKIRCYYKEDILKDDLKIGNKVKIQGKLYKFDKRSNVGQFDNQNYYRSLFFSASAYLNNISVIDNSYNKFLQWLYDAKIVIKNQVRKIFTKKNAGLFNCMITGDKSELDRYQKKLFNENGIAHILAISGLHLSILGLGLFELLRKKFRLRTSALVTSIFILLYGIFIDCSVTSLRAIIMLYVRFLSLAIGRTYDSKNTLYILFTIFLFINPYYLFNVGFLFSYTAILSLNLDYKIKIKKNYKYKTIKIPSVIILTLFLFPITVYSYFTYPLYSILLNLIVIPLMPFVLFFGILGTAVSFLSITLGKFLVGIVHLIILLYEKLCYLIEMLPYHKILIGMPSLTSIIIFYIVLFIIYCAMNVLNEYIEYDKDNQRISNDVVEDKLELFINKICDKKLFIYLFSVFLICISFTSMIIKPQKGLKISALSIGQGDSFVIKTEDKKAYTIDGGSTSNTSAGTYILSPNLKANQISIIEKAYISHADSDHTNALQYIIEEDEDIEVKEVVLPIVAINNEKYKGIISICENNNVKVSYMKRGEEDIISNNLYFYCISPSDKKSDINKDINEASLCLKLNYKNNSMMFAGDIGKDMEKDILKDEVVKNNLKSDILKVAHHGSRNSSSKKFIESVDPKIAILSYGYKNSYNHPHKETIKLLTSYDDLKIYNTVDSGEIDIYMDEGIKIKEYLR